VRRPENFWGRLSRELISQLAYVQRAVCVKRPRYKKRLGEPRQGKRREKENDPLLGARSGKEDALYLCGDVRGESFIGQEETRPIEQNVKILTRHLGISSASSG